VRNYWTQRGFNFIQDTLSKIGIYPVTRVNAEDFIQEEVDNLG